MLKKWLKEYVQINKREILIIVGLIMLGAIMGCATYIFSTIEIKQAITSSVKDVFELCKGQRNIKVNIILSGIKINTVIITLLGAFSIMLGGKYLIYCLAFIKGAALSLYAIIIFNVFGGIWGIVMNLLLVVFVNIIYIPAFIYLMIVFLEVNFSVFKSKLNISIFKLLLATVLCYILMFCSVVIEQLAGGIALSIYNKI